MDGLMMHSATNRSIILNRLKRFAVRPDAPIESKIAKNRVHDLDALYSSFSQALTANGGTVIQVNKKDGALESLENIMKELDADTAVISEDSVLKTLGLKEHLNTRGINVLKGEKNPTAHKGTCFSADVGITGADYALADTGTIVIFHGKNNARLLSLAPPAHIAIVEKGKLLPDIDTLVAEIGPSRRDLPSAMTLITGPSLTADIALQAIYGVHGPKKLYVIFIE